MAKPTDVTEWGTNVAAELAEPSLGQKQVGWVHGTRPPAHWFNWMWRAYYRWITWFESVLNTDNYETIEVQALAGSSRPAIKGVGTNGHEGGDFRGQGAAPGVLGYGGATGVGIDGLGGDTSGAGVQGTGVAGNALGVIGIGQGSGNGVRGTGGATGAGLQGVGGATSGAGVIGTGTAGNADGVQGNGQGTGDGVQGTGGATGAGVRGIGGATSGAGVIGTGTAGNAVGVNATGNGSGAGVTATGGATGSGVVGTSGGGTVPGVTGVSTSSALAAGVTGDASASSSGRGVVGVGGSSGRGFYTTGSVTGIEANGTSRGAQGISSSVGAYNSTDAGVYAGSSAGSGSAPGLLATTSFGGAGPTIYSTPSGNGPHLLLEPLASAPTGAAAVKGAIYMNTDGKLYVHDGGGFVVVGSQS